MTANGILPLTITGNGWSHTYRTPQLLRIILWEEQTVIQAANIICLDYSIAKRGSLIAYRWNGEEQINSDHFVRVKYKE